MTSIWWLVNVVSRMLEPAERDAVRGDFAESDEPAGKALRDVLGLVVRRQAALWKDWRPWLALLGMVGISAALLSELAFRFDADVLLQLRTYWRHGVHYGTGLTVGEDLVYFVCLFLAIFSWSWASGFVLGSLSGRAVWLTGTLFCLVVHAAHLAPLVLNWVLPLSVVMLPFLLAAIWGMNRGFRLRTLGFHQAFLLAAAIAILTALVTWTSGWYETVQEFWSQGALRAVPWPRRMLPLATLSWPVLYMLATASWRRWRDKSAV